MRLGHRLLGRIALINFAEIADALFDAGLRHGDTRFPFRLGRRILRAVALLLLRLGRGARRERLVVLAQESIDAHRRAMRVRHRADERGRAGDRVAAGVEAGHIRRHRRILGDDASPTLRRQARELVARDALTDGHDDRVSRKHGSLRVVELRTEAMSFIEHARAGAERHAGDFAVHHVDRGGTEAVVELHAFLERLGSFPGMRGHFFAAFKAREAHLLDARHTHRATRGIHRHIAAADHEHLGTDGGLVAVVHFIEEFQSRPDARRHLVGNVQRPADPRADGNEDGVELAARFALEQLARILHLRAGARLDAHIEDALDLAIEHVGGQTVARNAIAQHAAQLGLRIENRDGIAEPAQIERDGHARRAATDHGDLLGPRLARRGQRVIEFFPVRIDVVADETLQVADVQRIIHVGAITFVLTWMLADAAADR
ncbi:MAG: hypothetical protein NTY53_08445, partial [Kiritimatiellaeota bacterium]|nr:hypothetical protein [Kiritimatiellota bacterium]